MEGEKAKEEMDGKGTTKLLRFQGGTQATSIVPHSPGTTPLTVLLHIVDDAGNVEILQLSQPGTQQVVNAKLNVGHSGVSAVGTVHSQVDLAKNHLQTISETCKGTTSMDVPWCNSLKNMSAVMNI